MCRNAMLGQKPCELYRQIVLHTPKAHTTIFLFCCRLVSPALLLPFGGSHAARRVDALDSTARGNRSGDRGGANISTALTEI